MASPSRRQPNPFHEVIVKGSPLDGSMISWGLHEDFCDAGPYVYDIYWVESPASTDRVFINQVVDSYYTIDNRQRMWSKDLESYYLIVLTTAKGTYESPATRHGQSWNKQDWLHARYIARAENVIFKKLAGLDGYVLKRRIWGPKCPNCLDFDTDQPANPKCLRCFGTAIDGGYWPAFGNKAYPTASGDMQIKKETTTEMGVVQARRNMYRMLAYPHIADHDVYVDEGSGRRYYIRQTNEKAVIKNIPVIYECEFRLAPYTDIIYNFPYIEEDAYEEPIEITTVTVLAPTPIVISTVPPTDPEPEPEPEVPIDYVVPRSGMSIWFKDGRWYIGQDVGDIDSCLYEATQSGFPISSTLSLYSWRLCDGSPGGTLLAVFNETTGCSVDITSSSPIDINGEYSQSGTYNNIFVYTKE